MVEPRLIAECWFESNLSDGYLMDVIISLATDSAGKDKAPLRFDSGKRAVETKLLKLVLFIVGGIGTINCRVWMLKARVRRAHREVNRLFLSIGLP